MAALLTMQAKPERELHEDAALLHCCAGPRGEEFCNHSFELVEAWLYVSLAKKKEDAVPQQRSLPMGIKPETMMTAYKRLQAAIPAHLKKEIGEYTGAEVTAVLQYFDWIPKWIQQKGALAEIINKYNQHWSDRDFSQHGTRNI